MWGEEAKILGEHHVERQEALAWYLGEPGAGGVRL
jgi:hypothetical protein